MSNLCHYDVEQGRLVEAEESVADALRISEERDTPICTAWQSRGAGPAAVAAGALGRRRDDARTVLRSGDLPLSQLWPHLVLGMLLARRDGPPANPHLDELWRLVNRLDNPGMVAPAAAALAENAWITRRPDPRLDDPLVTGLFDPDLRRPRRRGGSAAAVVAAAGGSGHPAVGGPTSARGPRRTTSPTSGRWRCGTPGRPTTCWPPSRCSTPRRPRGGRPFRARLREAGVSAVPRGRLPPPGPTRPG